MQNLKLLTLGLLTVLLFSGCALTPPSSEALIFQQEKPDVNRSTFFPKPEYRQQSFASDPFQIFVSMTASPRGNTELDYAKEKFAPFIQEKLSETNNLTEDNMVVRNPNYLSLGIPITLINRDNVRWALNVGVPVLGMDATTKLANRTYLTANLGFADGELIIQQKLTQTETGGLALGGFYRAERRGFEINSANDAGPDLIFSGISDALSADHTFYNHIFGGRVNGYLDLGDESDSFIILRVAPGYAFNLKQPVINFSLSIRFGS